MAIFMHKIDHFCCYFPEALIILLKLDAKIQILLKATARFLFEVNR